MKLNIKIILSLIITTIFSLVIGNVYGGSVKLEYVNLIGVPRQPVSDNMYLNNSNILRMYEMEINNAPVYCLNPGLRADTSYNYIEITGDDNVNAELNNMLSNSAPYYGLNRTNILRALIASINDYNEFDGFTNEQIVTIKQILVWRSMKLVSTAEDINLNMNAEASSKMAMDVCNILGIYISTDEGSAILNKVSDLSNDLSTLIDGLETEQKFNNAIDSLKSSFFREIASTIYDRVVGRIEVPEVSLYQVVDENGNWISNTQKLIGNPTPQEEKIYKVNYIFLSEENAEVGRIQGVASGEFSGTQRYTAPNTYSYGGSDYVYDYSVKNLGIIIYSRTITFSEENVEINCYFRREYLTSKIHVNHLYTDSSGIERTIQSDNYNINDIRFEVPLNSTYADYFTNADTSPLTNITGINLTNNNTIEYTFKEGSEFTVNLYYKSKKLVVNYISLLEDGSKKESGLHWNTGEIAINSGWNFVVGNNIDKSWGGDYIGVKLFKNSDQIKTWNWFTTTFGYESDTKECAVYTYNVYYEFRNIHKKYTLVGNQLKTVSTKKGTTISNPESTQYNSADFSTDFVIKNSIPTLYANINDTYYEKLVFNKTFSIGVNKSLDNDNDKDNRKLRADEISINGEIKNYSDENSSNRAVSAIAKSAGYFTHADTSVINFYYTVEQPVTVLVRHIVKNEDGTYTVSNSVNLSFLRNADEKYYDSVMDKNRIVSNGYNQRKYHANASSYKDTVPSGFSEKFTIDKDDKLYLDKSRTLLYNGVQYVYKGYNTHKAYNINNTSNKLDINISGITTQNINNSIEVSSNGNANRTIYVDFYYEEEDYSTVTIPTPDPDPEPEPDLGDDPADPDPDDDPDEKYSALELKASPKLKFRSETGNNGEYLESDWDDSNKKVAYVPTSEKIRPYFETASYVPYTLSYKVSVKENKFVYELNELNVHQLVNDGHKVVNKKFTENSDAVMIGNSTLNVISDGIVTGSNITQATEESQKTKYNNLGIYATNIPVGDKTSINNFTGTKDVSWNKYNGLRLGDGTVQYRVVMVSGENHNNYNESNTVNVVDSMDVNVYTPMATADPEIITPNNGLVDHRPNTDSTLDSTVIQKGVEFTLTPKIKLDEKCGYNDKLPDLDKYLQGAYVIFEFDVQRNDTIIPAGEAIWVPKKVENGEYKGLESITVTPVVEVNAEGENESIKQLQEKITTVAVTINTTDELKNKFEQNVSTFLGDSYLVASNKTSKITDLSKNEYENYGINMYADSHYFVKNETATIVLARLYDFKITDCYDVDYKNVFRKTNTTNNTQNAVNDLTGICYYSGKNKVLLQYALDAYTTRSENTLLPLGPYKHTQYDYVKAPKLGYRVSFDVKTYGYYNEQAEQAKGKDAIRNTRKIKITPSYYYIGKDGSGFTKDIKLYYKNSSGKYVTFGQNDYNISFKPNDGYRNLSNTSETPDTTWLSDKLVNINVGNYFTLEPSTMMTTSNDNFIQTWYGEFKVPNSTIVIKDDGNLNNPLKDGYLGVIFKIECIDSEGNTNKTNKSITVLYDTNDRTKGTAPNTSQWDYEGYMGVKAGQDYSTSLQLEKGTWTISQDTYKDIKGTVVLFDLDEKASNDFD